MAEEKLIDGLTGGGHQFDGGPFALDLYRLLAMVLSDQRIAGLGDERDAHVPSVWELQNRFCKAEILRILISSAVALRVLLDQDQRQVRHLRKQQCGSLWASWPKDRRKPGVLTLREACNKIIHSEDIRHDEVIPDRRYNPDEVGSYIRPFMYLYGTRRSVDWRAKLSIVEF